VRLYSARTGKQVCELAGQARFLFAPDGRMLVTQGPGGLTFWDLPPRKPPAPALGLALLPALAAVWLTYPHPPRTRPAPPSSSDASAGKADAGAPVDAAADPKPTSP